MRAVVETVHHASAGAALPRLREGLPPHLLRVLHRDVLGTLERDATVELELALSLLLSIDTVLCGGSGLVTRRAAAALASRVLSQSEGLLVPGDAVATLQHLRAPFEQPFVDAPLSFQVRRSSDGFVLELSMPTELRAARWLGPAGLGYARAATRFSGEGAGGLRLHHEVRGDVARVLGRRADSGVVHVPARALGPARDERRPPRRRSSATNAAARVEAILGRAGASAAAPSATTSPPPPPMGEPRVARASSRPPPPLQRESAESGSRPVAARGLAHAAAPGPARLRRMGQ